MEDIEIAVGTYENLILGYRIQRKVEGGFTLESSFTTDSHRGALRCLAVSPQGVLASSSTDDSIRLHSLKKRKEVGSLFQHDGSVNCIQFFRGGHMFSASEDGTICLWKCKNWELLRVLKGHRCQVMSVAVHPSAKLGLSVGSDRTFFTWDLTTGKLAFKRKTDQVVQSILFTQDGNNYVLVYQKKIEVCSLEDTMVLQEIVFDSRINSVCFVEEDILAVGEDDGKLSIINVVSSDMLLQHTFKGRLRSLHSLTTKTEVLLFVASSTGCLRVCSLDLTKESEQLDVVVVFDAGVRITCMTAYAPREILKDEEQLSVGVKRKKRRKHEDDTLEDEDGVEKADDEEEEDLPETPKIELDLGSTDEDEDANEIPAKQLKKKKKKNPALMDKDKRNAPKSEDSTKKAKKVNDEDSRPKKKKKRSVNK